jgi:hypothetical protein
MQGNGMVLQADTVQGLALSADGFTLALVRRNAGWGCPTYWFTRSSALSSRLTSIPGPSATRQT